jgi:hypothetical protein
MVERLPILAAVVLAFMLVVLLIMTPKNDDIKFDCALDNKQIPSYNVPMELTGQIAMAMINYQDEPVILYDKRLVSNLSQKFQAHIKAHECAHILLGHVTPKKLKELSSYNGGPGAPLYQQREDDADCKAVEILVANGWNQRQFVELVADWRTAPIPQDKMTSRITTMLQCPAYPKN